MDLMEVDLMTLVKFADQYRQEHPSASKDEINAACKEYLKSQRGQVQQASGSKKSQLEKAFNLPFRDPVNYLRALRRRIDQVANSDDYNYLTIIQSSGYGKTRAGCELAAECPLVYICFRQSDSSGYPPATPKSMAMLEELRKAANLLKAEGVALSWIRSIILTFHEKREEFHKKRSQEKYQQVLLKNKQQAIDFWNAVDSNRGKGETPETDEKIILFIDEASALLYGKDHIKNNQPFRAVRRALHQFRAHVTGLLADTNPSVANLAPLLQHDPSAREPNYKVHKPFIYLATMDCQSVNISLEEDGSGHDIVRFGRPLWGSLWTSDSDSPDKTKFKAIIKLAKFKLLGGIDQWDQDPRTKQKVALAIVACIAILYISPISSEAPDLVRLHMATLVGIDDDRKKHLITYPSEPVLSEAALEVLSENGAELGVLKELDAANKSSGILDAGGQGELVVRLLFSSAWRRLICSERNNGVKVSFSTRRPVLDFLQELFKDFPRKKFSYLKNFNVGFTHFIGLKKDKPDTSTLKKDKPDTSTLKCIWNRRGAMHFKRNQEGSDFGLVLQHKTDKDRFGALVVQIKNFADKQSTPNEISAAGPPLEPILTFTQDCADAIKDNYLGVYVHIGAAYHNTRELVPINYHPPNTRSTSTTEFHSNNNRLIVRGLGSFKLEHRNIFESLLCAWNEPIQFCAPDDKQLLYRMLPCTYPGAEERLLQEEAAQTPKDNNNKGDKKKEKGKKPVK